MNGSRATLLVLGWFGLVAVLNGWIGLQTGEVLVPATTVLAGVVLITTAVVGILREDGLGFPDEPGLSLYVGLLAAGVYTVATVFRLL